MQKALTRGALVALLLLLALQLVPVDRTNEPVKTELLAPPAIRTILQRSCYDCHSNLTRWPWYSWVAPVSWLVARHVHQGRDELNLTEWPLFDLDSQRYLLGEIKNQVKQRQMPLDSYLLVHRDARLSAEQRHRLITWLDEEILLLSGP